VTLAATNWDEWVAVGTLALAGTTVLLAIGSSVGVWVQAKMARETTRLVEAAERELLAVLAQSEATSQQAAVAQAALDASVQPMLGPVPVGEFDEADAEADRGEVRWRFSDDYLLISVPFRNVGSGVALVTSARISDRDGKMFERAQEVGQTAIPPGESTRVFFSLRVPENNDIVRSNVQLVTVRYADVSGRQRFRSVAAVREVYHHDPQVVRVGVYRDDDEDPFVTIGPLPFTF
jgi:hypothetical protein